MSWKDMIGENLHRGRAVGRNIVSLFAVIDWRRVSRLVVLDEVVASVRFGFARASPAVAYEVSEVWFRHVIHGSKLTHNPQLSITK